MNRPFPDSTEILKSLVAFPTVYGSERPAALWLCDLLSRLGMEVSLQEVAEGRANVFASVGSGETLLLSGHLDVVSAAGAWTSPPFELTRRGDAWYGRGTADMKGAIAAMISALRRFLERDGQPRARLALLFVADEEKDNRGTRRFLNGFAGDIRYALIGEPTGLELAVAHKGFARFRVTVRGRSAHSAVAARGLNALEGAALLISALREENRLLEGAGHFILPPQTLHATVLHAEEGDNIIPGEARLVVDHRIFPGVSPAQAEERMRRVLARASEGRPAFRYELEPHAFLAGGEVDLDDPFVHFCRQAAQRALNRPCPAAAFTATCEQSLMLKAGIRTLILGPGSIDQAHTVDEYLEDRQLKDAESVYYELIRSFCEAGGEI